MEKLSSTFSTSFLVLSQAKLKEVFVGPQINKLLKDKGFDHTLSGTEKVA